MNIKRDYMWSREIILAYHRKLIEARNMSIAHL